MSDALVPIEPETTAMAPVGLFGGSSPAETVRKATEVADALADVIRAKHLYKTIGAKNHVLVEGWTLLGTMLGVYPVCVWTRKIEGGWEARVEARTLSGAVVGAAEASCMEAERNWKGRDEYAIRSMAQTRAASKALRQPLGFVVVLAGYEATPAEEMPVEPKGTAVAQDQDMTPELEASIAYVQQARARSAAAVDAYVTVRCPECASECDVYPSSQTGKNAGRKYRQCKVAHDNIEYLIAQEGFTAQKAAALNTKHYRQWVEPSRKNGETQGAAPESGSRPEPPPTEEPAPSIFDADQIAADVAARLAREGKA